MSRLRRNLHTLLYLVTAVPMGAAGAAVLLAGWIACIVLAPTPLVVPALAAFRATVRLLARAEAGLARTLVGSGAHPARRSRRKGGFWRLAVDVLGDGGFWKQQVFLFLRYVLGGACAIAELSLIAAGLGAIALPVSYRWSAPNIGSWKVDTIGRALLFLPAGIIAFMVAILLLRPLGAVWRSLADGLLGESVPGDSVPDDNGRSGHEPDPQPRVPRSPRSRLQPLAIASVTVAVICALQVVIWAATSHGYFWPIWTIVTLGIGVAIYGWIVVVLERKDLLALLGIRRGLAIHAGVSVGLAAYFIPVWAFSSHGYFWPVWPMLVLLVALVGHVTAEVIRSIRSGELSDRIAVLETSRAGAVDQQETELRRIERDLHDGAQARLVALGMSLGLAEQKLGSDPAAARALLADARRGAGEALQELRDLARGIHPPVLADRGLEAAVAALTSRSALPVKVDVAIDERPPPTVETAAYFVVAEALANIGKHANATRVEIAIHRNQDTLVVEVADDGSGGANRTGTGLSGLTRRVEALDGSLEVASPPGGPTTVRAVIPCGS